MVERNFANTKSYTNHTINISFGHNIFLSNDEILDKISDIVDDEQYEFDEKLKTISYFHGSSYETKFTFDIETSTCEIYKDGEDYCYASYNNCEYFLGMNIMPSE